MPKPPDPKCQTCSQMPAARARELHPCWDKDLCRKRRHYYRKRAARMAQESPPSLAIAPPDNFFAVLILYKERGEKPLHALGAQLWRGQEAVCQLEPVHCFGLTSSQIRAYSESVLQSFSQRCGTPLRQYRDMFELPPSSCPVRPCPLHPEF